MGKQKKAGPLLIHHGDGATDGDFAQGANKHLKRSKKNASRLLVQPQPDWHNVAAPNIEVPNTLSPVLPSVLDSVHQHANSLLDAESATYAATRLKSSSSHKFMTTVLSSGTWSDKVSALTLIVQESPLHTRKQLENLLSLAGKRSRNQALMALSALKDMICQGELLPSHRKLRAFKKQPELLGSLQGLKSWVPSDDLPGGLQKTHLLLWAYEDWLKHQYFEMLKILESWCGDEVEFARLRSVTFIWELLKEKPEQEENLLRLLVNKLGDTNKKIASRASHLLLQLQVFHPSMKSIVVSAVESEILLRPGQTAHAKYYAVITLNQTVLQSSDPDTANKLLDVYFTIFIGLLNQTKHPQTSTSARSAKSQSTNPKKRKYTNKPIPTNPTSTHDVELSDKITAQVLTGINRAFPYTKHSSTSSFESHLDTLFRITHSANFNTAVQALMLVQHITSTLSFSVDRFLRTLYESLLDPRLVTSSKQTMYLNLLYRSLKADVSLRRVKAFVKRLLQVLCLHEPPFVTGALYLVHELMSMFPGMRGMLERPEEGKDDDEEEVFRDVPDPEDPRPHKTHTPAKSSAPKYDPRKRDPEHCNADRTCLWDILPYLTHYHPSTTLFASTLIPPLTPSTTQRTPNRKAQPTRTSPAPPKPDPASHTLTHFLDRFVYRNPKTKHLSQPPSSTNTPSSIVRLRGTSLMQPALASTQTTDHFLLSSSGLRTENAGDHDDAPVNSEVFWRRKAQDVAPEDAFFHRYFSAVGPRRLRSKEKRREATKEKQEGGFDEEVGAGEDEIWRALVGSNPELGGEGDDGAGWDEDEDEDEDGSDGGLGDVLAEDDGDDEEEEEEDEDGDKREEDAGPGVELNLSSDEEESPVEFSEASPPSPSPPPPPSDEEAKTPPNHPLPSLKIPEEKNGKAKGKDKANKHKRRKLSNLPVFAAAEDYADALG